MAAEPGAGGPVWQRRHHQQPPQGRAPRRAAPGAPTQRGQTGAGGPAPPGLHLPSSPALAAPPCSQEAARRRALPLVGFEKKPRPERSASPGAAGAGRVSGAGAGDGGRRACPGTGVAVALTWGHGAVWVGSVAAARRSLPLAQPAAVPVTREGLWAVSSFRWGLRGLGNSRLGLCCCPSRGSCVP